MSAETPYRWSSELMRFPGRVATFCTIELARVKGDPYEILIRLIQPVLWLVLYGETLNQAHIIDTGSIPYLEYIAPGIIAQSAIFVAIFYGVMLVWERDSGVLTKLLATPTPRTAIVAGKAFAASLRGALQAFVVMALCAVLLIPLHWNVVNLLVAVGFVVLGASFFSCLSMIVATVVRQRERMMGIGQAISLPLFFASSALYPTGLMPWWLRAVSQVNPMSYQVDALRGLLDGTPAHLLLDAVYLAACLLAGVLLAGAMLMRLAQ